MTFPVRWAPGTTHFKKPISAQVERRVKKATVDAKEEKHKAAVRRRDKHCRFPLCGCRKLKLTLHVSHQTHKGIGGNPAGDRSTPDKMIYVCGPRHRENSVSIDRGTLAWRALTDKGSDGPVEWYLPEGSLIGLGGGGSRVLAREKSIGTWERFTPKQKALLLKLAEMKL